MGGGAGENDRVRVWKERKKQKGVWEEEGEGEEKG